MSKLDTNENELTVSLRLIRQGIKPKPYHNLSIRKGWKIAYKITSYLWKVAILLGVLYLLYTLSNGND